MVHEDRETYKTALQFGNDPTGIVNVDKATRPSTRKAPWNTSQAEETRHVSVLQECAVPYMSLSGKIATTS